MAVEAFRALSDYMDSVECITRFSLNDPLYAAEGKIVFLCVLLRVAARWGNDRESFDYTFKGIFSNAGDGGWEGNACQRMTSNEDALLYACD